MKPGLLGLKISAPSYRFAYEKKQMRKTLRAAGNEIAQAARAILRRSEGGGRTYRGPGGSTAYRGGYKAGAYRASAAGEAPVRVTGTLARSVRVRVFRSGEGVAIRENAFYALFLAKGAAGGGRKGGMKTRRQANATSRVLQPRPSLTTALDQRSESLEPRILASLTQDVAFVRVRAR